MLENSAVSQRLTSDLVAMQKLGVTTGWRYRLKPWERVAKITYFEDLIGVKIDTYMVREMAREDRYESKGVRYLMFERIPNTTRWRLEYDDVTWDEDFVPFVFEKVGRRKTAEEFTDQRDWEKMCYRPGPGLDSYARVTDPVIPSTKRMERHY